MQINDLITSLHVEHLKWVENNRSKGIIFIMNIQLYKTLKKIDFNVQFLVS